ncbi:hypothetical protein [Streptomyces sp. SP18BB07]|uniref:hypothetical protein n=1 Tax=Streptomyces sp. SP18BB07 TaxID=3002522 RepID=UPI003FCC499D
MADLDGGQRLLFVRGPRPRRSRVGPTSPPPKPQGRTRVEEVERAVAIGGRVIADHTWPDGGVWVLMADRRATNSAWSGGVGLTVDRDRAAPPYPTLAVPWTDPRISLQSAWRKKTAQAGHVLPAVLRSLCTLYVMSLC